MPAYNAGKYILQSIDSIIAQTFKEWELIIADDCSTDNTVEIIEKCIKKHKNIKLIKRNSNSGGARLPRKDAAEAATTNLIMTFDADDFLDKDYIEKMYHRKKETKSDIVLGTLLFCDENGKSRQFQIPTNNFNYNNILTGKEATKLLLGKVLISVNGLLVNKELYLNNIRSTSSNYNNMPYVDEIDQRTLLISCKNVSFVNTIYNYRQHSKSLMHLNDFRRYSILEINKAIYKFAKKHYIEKEVFNDLNNDFINNLLYCYRDYYYYKHNKSTHSTDIERTLKDSYNYARKEKMKPKGTKQIVCMAGFHILKLASYIYGTYLRIKRN